jgi:hypothetical protein
MLAPVIEIPGRVTMKKFTTAAFAALIALALSMPAWSQNTTQTPSNASKTTTGKTDTKTDSKKETSKKSKTKKKKGTTQNSDKSTAPASTNQKK